MLQCSLLFIYLVLEILITTIKWTCIIIKWIYNTVKYCIDKHNENKATKVLNQYDEPRAFEAKINTINYNAYEATENNIKDIEIIEVEKVYTKPSIDIFN